MLIKNLLLPGLLTLAVTTGAHAAQVTIDTSFHPLQAGTDNQGWWSSTASNSNPTNDNYYTGDNDTYRSFFSFDLSGLSGTVTSATFEVRRYDQVVPVTLGLFDVNTPASTLITTRTNIQNPAVFADLGSGNSYGVYTVQPGNSFDVLSFALNGQALADINAALGSGYFSIGAALQGSGTIFSASGDEPGNGGGIGYTQRLVLNISPAANVPEPSGVALAGAGLAIVATLARRKARRA